MNKKLIALAVAGACVAPAAMAQTANPVTLYGKVYVTFESIEAGGGTAAQNAATTRRTRVDDQASRLGVKGTEDLGGGLKAVFQLETAFRPDQNNTVQGSAGVASAQAFAARNSFVGLQGGWGTIIMGRHDTPWKVVTGALDPFGDVTIGGFKTVMNDGPNFDRRDQNVIQYWSPVMAGFNVRLQYQANESKSAASDPKDYGGSLTYTGGPVYLMYAYEQHKDCVGSPMVTCTTTAGSRETGNALGGSFRVGGFLIGALYERAKKSGREDYKAWMGNVVWTIGNNQLIYQYATGDGGFPAGLPQLDCNSNVFGWQYNFSKRTFFLAQYTTVKNENAVSLCGSNTFTNSNPGGAGLLNTFIAGGQDPKGFTLGISHVF